MDTPDDGKEDTTMLPTNVIKSNHNDPTGKCKATNQSQTENWLRMREWK